MSIIILKVIAIRFKYINKYFWKSLRTVFSFPKNFGRPKSSICSCGRRSPGTPGRLSIAKKSLASRRFHDVVLATLNNVVVQSALTMLYTILSRGFFYVVYL